MTVQNILNSGCTLWPVYVIEKSLTVYSTTPAFGEAANTSAVIGSDKHGDQCTDGNIIGVPYGLDQDQSTENIGALTALTEDGGHSRMIMPARMPQHMILTDKLQGVGANRGRFEG